MDGKVAQALEIVSKCPHNVAQSRGPKIRPKLGRVADDCVWRIMINTAGTSPSPRNHRIPIYRFCLQTAFRARMRIFKSGISGSGNDQSPKSPIHRLCLQTTFHARMSVFKPVISGSGYDALFTRLERRSLHLDFKRIARVSWRQPCGRLDAAVTPVVAWSI
jgi:hypothetical protein